MGTTERHVFTLAETGIDKHLADRARKMAACKRSRAPRIEASRCASISMERNSPSADPRKSFRTTLCKFRGIYGNSLHLPRLIPPCGGTRAAIPHIPRAKPGDGGGPTRTPPGPISIPGTWISCENTGAGKVKRAAAAIASAYERIEDPPYVSSSRQTTEGPEWFRPRH